MERRPARTARTRSTPTRRRRAIPGREPGRQRWAVYLFGIVAVIGLVTDLAAGLPPMLLLVRVLLLGVLFRAIADRWEAFR